MAKQTTETKPTWLQTTLGQFKAYNNKMKDVDFNPDPNKSTEKDPKEKLGAAGWTDLGLNGLGTIANITMGGVALAQAQDQIKKAEAQRQLENKRYNEQLARNKKATDDTANTASTLQSASGEMQGTQTQQQELPMQRQ